MNNKDLTVQLDNHVVKIDAFISAEIMDETVMMSVEKGQYFGLNPVASRVWEVLAEPIQVSALCDQLRKEFDVDLETCRQDVLDLLQKLVRWEMIRVLDE